MEDLKKVLRNEARQHIEKCLTSIEKFTEVLSRTTNEEYRQVYISSIEGRKKEIDSWVKFFIEL